MPDFSLPQLLSSLHEDMQSRLAIARRSFGHSGTKGDASEKVWRDLLSTYLPKRYSVTKAHVVDSRGKFSDQLDAVVFDRQYSPFIFKYEGEVVVPAESVYAVFEAKQTADGGLIGYAQQKVASVRSLHRTSLPIPHAGGTFAAKPLIPILGGFLSLESEWKPPLGDPLADRLAEVDGEGRLDVGCIASHGRFSINEDGTYALQEETKPATAFLFDLIARLQFSGTVPMIDIHAYGDWLRD